jgi:Ran GTPase-activating protein (RanGAP) involved in mRNA processing and transport
MTRNEIYETLASDLKKGLAEIATDLVLLRTRLVSNNIGTEKFVELSQILREQEYQRLQMLERLYQGSTRWDKIREEIQEE